MTYEELIELSHQHPILFYDGVCMLCNGFVNAVIKHDPDAHVKFCILQNETGIAIREQLSLGSDISTTIGVHKGEVSTHSDVLHMIVKATGGWWSVVRPLYILPKSLRDIVYNWVARNRYRWFGKSESCIIPHPDVLSRFID